MNEEVYLGDGVYIKEEKFEPYRLYTTNEIAGTNEIFLNEEVVINLLKYLNSRYKK